MALWIRDTSSVPDGGWRYPHVVGGVFVHAPNYNALYGEIEKAYRANEQPVPSPDDVVRWLCEHLFVPCVEGNQPLVNHFSQGLPVKAPAGCCG